MNSLRRHDRKRNDGTDLKNGVIGGLIPHAALRRLFRENEMPAGSGEAGKTSGGRLVQRRAPPPFTNNKRLREARLFFGIAVKRQRYITSPGVEDLGRIGHVNGNAITFQR